PSPRGEDAWRETPPPSHLGPRAIRSGSRRARLRFPPQESPRPSESVSHRSWSFSTCETALTGEVGIRYSLRSNDRPGCACERGNVEDRIERHKPADDKGSLLVERAVGGGLPRAQSQDCEQRRQDKELRASDEEPAIEGFHVHPRGDRHPSECSCEARL